MAAQLVIPYRQRGKNDAHDADGQEQRMTSSKHGKSMRSGMVLAIAGLFAVLGCLILACASKQPKPTAAQTAQTALTELRGAVLADIVDQTRAHQAATVVDQLADQDRGAREAGAAKYERVLALDANYDATEADLNKLFTDFNNERLQRQHRIVELWTQMAGLTTDAEWGALKKARVAAGKALLNPG